MTAGNSYSPPPAFGRFRLLHQIGAGVLGPVFRTHDPEEDRLVAVKVFTLDLTPEQSVRLADELGQLADAGAPILHVAAPISAGVVDTVAYLAQSYVSGESLDAALRQYGPAPAPDAARLVNHVADALEAAARVGLFHGSLHPRDILVTPGETHLTGLGVAQALEKQGVRPPVRRPYAAPEREEGASWAAPADVFALAAIAHEVLTGKRALPGTAEPFPGLDALKDFETAQLRDALDAAMDPDPGRRPSASEFAAAFAASLGVGTGATPPAGTKSKRRARARAVPKLPGLDEPLEVAVADASGGQEPAADHSPREIVPEAVSPSEPQAVAPEPDLSVMEALAPTVSLTPDLSDIEVGPRPSRSRSVDLSGLEDVMGAGDKDAAAPELDFDLDPAEALARQPLVVDSTADLADLLIAQPPPQAPTSPAGAVELMGGVVDESRAEEPESIEEAPPAPPVEEPPASLRERQRQRDTVPPPRRTHAPAVDEMRPMGGATDDIPRAIDPGSATRGGAATRRVEPYRPLPPKPRPPVIPIAAGLLAGLLLGGVGGYWLGSRSEPAAPVKTAAVAAPVQVTQIPETPAPVPVTTTTQTAPGTTAPAATPQGAGPAPLPVAEAEPPKPAAPRTPTARTGSITVRSEPSRANVFLDGKARGTTPRSLAKLPMGTYTIRVTRQGYQAHEKTITLSAAEPNARLTVTLTKPPARPAAPTTTVVPSGAPAGAAAPARPAPGVMPSAQSPLVQAAQAAQGVGAIDIDTRPAGARIRLDGAAAGVSPAVLDNVKAGSHTVRLELDGFRVWTTTIVIKPGTRTRIAASLERSSTR